VRGFQELIVQKIFDTQGTTWSHFKLIQSFLNRVCCDFDDVDYLGDGAAEVIHTSSEDEASTADTRWASSHDHPIQTHTLNKANCIFSNFVEVITKFEF